MKKNLGRIDRIARWSLAAIVFILYATGILYGIIGTILLVLAIIISITGSIGFCPIYLMFKINNYRGKGRDSSENKALTE